MANQSLLRPQLLPPVELLDSFLVCSAHPSLRTLLPLHKSAPVAAPDATVRIARTAARTIARTVASNKLYETMILYPCSIHAVVRSNGKRSPR
jgi:hypothetical protein